MCSKNILPTVDTISDFVANETDYQSRWPEFIAQFETEPTFESLLNNPKLTVGLMEMYQRHAIAKVASVKAVAARLNGNYRNKGLSTNRSTNRITTNEPDVERNVIPNVHLPIPIPLEEKKDIETISKKVFDPLEHFPKADEKKRKRGHRIPEDFEPSAELLERALLECPLVTDIPRQVIKFRNYWLSRSDSTALKLDWQRTFWNRLYDLQERAEKNNSQSTSALDELDRRDELERKQNHLRYPILELDEDERL
jgi:hypothetical protein